MFMDALAKKERVGADAESAGPLATAGAIQNLDT
jgi:hypothetical protein